MSFPDHGKYLEKVAQQRLETTNFEDLDLDFELEANTWESDDDSSSNSADSPDIPHEISWF
jgi:hypothetical protein